MKLHYTHPYLIAPVHQLTVDVVGVGGTGSQVLTCLARMNEALMGLGHPGLHVRAWDPDVVTTSNMGRQLFSAADLGQNKAIVLITRINRYFGYNWQAMPESYKAKTTSNIMITCIDTAKGRIAISERLEKNQKSANPTERPYYWLDIGNMQKSGQVVLGTIQPIDQPKKSGGARTLRTVVQLFPELKKIVEKNQGPSCSLAEALERQDLFINSTLAQLACSLLWKMIREGKTRQHGCYLNLETMNVNPISIR